MCQILEHVLRTAERRLDADHPFFSFERTQESVERFWLAQMGQSPRKPEFALSIGSHQPAQESPAKASCEYGHRKEVWPPAGDPPGAIQGEATGWDQATQVRVSQHFWLQVWSTAR